MRIFVALEPASDFAEALSAWVRPLADRIPRLRLVPPASMHLTLAFLGELDAECAIGVVQATHRALARASEIEPAVMSLRLSAGRLVALPSPRRASVLAVEVREGARESAILAARLEDEFERAGAAGDSRYRTRERRPFRAHLTLARISGIPARLAQAELGQPGPRPGFTAPVDSLTVFSSTLGPGGARYEALERIALRNEDALE